MDWIKIKAKALDIRVWIFIFFLLRLVGITNAPLEVGHNWRQSFTAMVARNFVEFGPNVFYPMVDFGGNRSGIISSEFPIFNFLIYLVSAVFSYDHWYGRLINLIISSVGLYYFYKLVRFRFEKSVAFNATIILTTSIWFAFSRKIMPDTFSISLFIIGLYYGIWYLKYGKWSHLALYFALVTLGVLSKIPAATLLSGALLIPLFFRNHKQRRILFSISSVLSILLVGWWYFYWSPYLLKTYHLELYTPKGLIEGFLEIVPHAGELFEKFYFSAFHSFVAFGACLVGLYFFLKHESAQLKYALAIIFGVFVIFILKTGAIFPTHNYYIIPIVPVMAILAGIGLSNAPVKIGYILLTVIAVEGIANQSHDFFIKQDQLYKLELEAIVDNHTQKQDLIVINGGPSPQDIYFAHQKGWSLPNDKAIKSKTLDSLHALGAHLLIFDKTKFEPVDLPYPQVYADEHYNLYMLAEPKARLKGDVNKH